MHIIISRHLPCGTQWGLNVNLKCRPTKVSVKSVLLLSVVSVKIKYTENMLVSEVES